MIMWFEWLVRRCDMDALAVVSPVQPPSDVEQQDSKNDIFQFAHDGTSLRSRREAEQRASAPHVFSLTSPLPGPVVVTNELGLSPVWNLSFDNSLSKDLDYHTSPCRLKALSNLLLGYASSEGRLWVSEPLNQLSKNYLQTVEKLKQSRFINGHNTPLESKRYRELKAGFWKRLATDSHKGKLCDSSSMSGARASIEQFNGGIRSSNPSLKKASLSRLQRSYNGRGGPGPNGSIEIEVMLIGKWNANALEEAIMVPKPELATYQVQQNVASHVQNMASHVQNMACRKDIQHHQELNLHVCDGIAQSSPEERNHDDNVCRTRASSRNASDGRSLERDVATSHVRRKGNPLQYQRRQEQRQKDGSECSFGSEGGIGRGRIGEDGSPMNPSSNHQACEESKASAENLKCNMKEEDRTFWSSANWCVVDSYMTGHGKETTWTVRGFEEDDGIFEGNLPDCKDKSPFKIFANEKNHSCFSDLFVPQFRPVKAFDVETRHGPPPKWTQQALQEQVAKNLRAQHQQVRSSKNGLEMVRTLTYKQTEEGTDIDDGGRDEEVECQEVVVDDLMLHCRKGRKLLKEVVLKETHDKVGGGDMEAASLDMNDIESASWKSVRCFSNACACPSTCRTDQDKELLNLVARREIQRRKRRWAKKKEQLPAIAMASCVSMVGDIVKALRRTREDAAALVLKLAALQAVEVKDFKATTSAMRTHVDLLWSEVKGLETEWGFNVMMVFPWQQFLKNIVIGISLVSGTLDLHRAIKFIFRLLFGYYVQTTTSRKEKTMVVVIILCSGNYIGKEMWQIFSQVQAKNKKNEAIFQEKLLLVLERLSHMSTLTYKNGIVHQGQAEDIDQTV